MNASRIWNIRKKIMKFLLRLYSRIYWLLVVSIFHKSFKCALEGAFFLPLFSKVWLSKFDHNSSPLRLQWHFPIRLSITLSLSPAYVVFRSPSDMNPFFYSFENPMDFWRFFQHNLLFWLWWHFTWLNLRILKGNQYCRASFCYVKRF